MKLTPRLTYTLLGCFLFLLVLLGLVMKTNTYYLNKNVRIISTRFIQFERLSLIRKELYRFEFQRDFYLISQFDSQENVWTPLGRHPYLGEMEVSPSGFEVFFEEGQMKLFRLDGKEMKLKSYLILDFFSPKKPAKKKGIIFYKGKTWRPLI